MMSDQFSDIEADDALQWDFVKHAIRRINSLCLDAPEKTPFVGGQAIVFDVAWNNGDGAIDILVGQDTSTGEQYPVIVLKDDIIFLPACMTCNQAVLAAAKKAEEIYLVV
jgi:hypothetical protein